MATILCVDDEATSLLVLQSILDAAGHDTTGVSSVDAALDVLSRGEFDLIISDYRMPGATGLELLARLRELGIETPLIMATGYATIEHAVASIKSGAIDYITKPFREEQLRLVVDQALELVSLRRENETLRDQVSQIRTARRVVGENAGMARLMETVRMIAPSRASVLLQGESGTGKELIARAIHEPRQCAIHLRELRGVAGDTRREHAVRAREGSVHGRRAAGEGRVRAGPQRNAAAGRSLRDATRPAGEAAARHPGAGVRAGRRDHV